MSEIRLREQTVITFLRMVLEDVDRLPAGFDEKERQFLVSELRTLSADDAWWSDSEWDWFLRRTLDFLGVPNDAS